MRKMLGGIFFVGAAVYLSAAKSVDAIMLAAVITCAVLAGLSVTRYSDWSIIGGAMLIAGSLFLQSTQSYRCMDCFRADIMILAGVISLTVAHRGRLKTALRALTSLMTVMMMATVILHTGQAGMANAEGMLSGTELGRYITVAEDEGSIITLDTAVKPVLFYSPTCGTCKEAVEELIKLDPRGRRWTPVQVKGVRSEGIKFLMERGYQGYAYISDIKGSVPLLVVTRDGRTEKIFSPEKMLKVIRGDAG